MIKDFGQSKRALSHIILLANYGHNLENHREKTKIFFNTNLKKKLFMSKIWKKGKNLGLQVDLP